MRRVLVTGGSRGIGKAISNLFSDNGYDVCSPGRGDLDLSSKESIKSFIERNNKGFDIIINNAGVNPIKSIEELCDKDIEDTVMINFVAPMLIIRGFASKMKKEKNGRIVNIGSIWSVASKPKRSVYSATKHGIHGLTAALSLEFSEFGILVNTVSPGFTLTDMTKQNNTADEIKMISDNIPLKRMADPKEIAKVIFFLGSYENTYITGQNIVVDGGYTVQ